MVLGKFDIREDLCMSAGGFKHGDAVEVLMGETYTIVGLQQESGRVTYWARPRGQEAAVPLTRGVTELWHKTGEEALSEAQSVVSTTLRETFPYLKAWWNWSHRVACVRVQFLM